MAMTHVILSEFYVKKEVPYFLYYVKKYTDLPFLVIVDEDEGKYRSDRFLRSSDLHDDEILGEWKTVVWDEVTGKLVVPNGSQGYRWDESDKWNLELEREDGTRIDPQLSFIDASDEVALVTFPEFSKQEGDTVERGVPIKYIKDKQGNELKVTTVYDLMMAHTGVNRKLPGDYPTDYDDVSAYTPAWQESITGVNKNHVIKVAKEFADNAKRTKGKSMIAMGGGTNHWYHSDQIYRAILNLVLLTGSQGVNGGGWAHYVGQEKVRPVEGWQQVAFANDWIKPQRLQNGTSFFYFHTEQFRYESDVNQEQTDWGGKYSKMHPADANALSARLGWLPSFPQFTQNSIDLVKESRNNGAETHDEIIDDVVGKIKKDEVDWAVENPEDPQNFPRVFFNWRSNLMGDSGKGHEYFVRHLIGGDDQILSDTDQSWQPEDVNVEEDIPEGKLDLLVSIDFRMTSSGLFSDIVLPAATWYEKYDISSTDLHPFVHPFNAAITPPWEAKSDWDTFKEIAKVFSELAEKHLPAQEDLMMTPLGHDSEGEIAQPLGKIKDWRKEESEAVPGKTMPNLQIVTRDYPNLYEQMTTIGPELKKDYSMQGVSS